MGILVNPYLSIPGGRAREAMQAYAEIFGGDLTVNTFGEYGDQGPSKDLVMHARLESPLGVTLMASDTHEQMPPMTVGDNISVSLSGDDEAVLRRCWDGLAEGATIGMPLERQMWGDIYGQLTDRFGTQWMVNIATPQE
jgi:PhnB protein